MNPSLAWPLAAWQNFYVIVGSSAGALTGLQFVVLALLMQVRGTASRHSIRAFGTPNITHFCAALVISALMAAPWRSFFYLSLCLGICGVAGVVYSINTFRYAHKAEYNADFEDWIWFVAIPLIAHIVLVGSASVFRWNLQAALWGTAVASLVFLLVGIRNAWDTVTYLATSRGSNAPEAEQTSSDRPREAGR